MENKIKNIIAKFVKMPSNTEGVVFKFEKLKSGHINDTFKVEISDALNPPKNYILQNINTNIFIEPMKIMQNIETVAKHLKSQDYTKEILSCLKTLDGNFLYTDENNRIWRVLPFIENTYSILKVENENQAFEAAKAFGEYARFLSDLEVSKIETIIPNFHNADFRIQQFNDALQNPNSQLRQQIARNELIIIEKYISKFKNIQLNIPLRITHNDTKISNILFDKTTQKAACIIDLDTLQPSTILSDFGDMVRAYTPQYDEDFKDFQAIEMRFSYFEALLTGFLSELKNILTKEEKAHLIYGASRTVFVQALRFLTDYLNHDIYYKTDYDDHNLTRTKNQLALFGSIEKQARKMQKLV